MTENPTYDDIKSISSNNLLANLDAHPISISVIDRFANDIVGFARFVLCADATFSMSSASVTPVLVNSTCFAANFSGGQLSFTVTNAVAGRLNFDFSTPDYPGATLPPAFSRVWYTDGNFVFESVPPSLVASSQLVSVSMQRRAVGGVSSTIQLTTSAQLIVANGSAISSVSTLNFFAGVAIFQISNNVAETVELVVRDTSATDFSTAIPGSITFISGSSLPLEHSNLLLASSQILYRRSRRDVDR